MANDKDLNAKVTVTGDDSKLTPLTDGLGDLSDQLREVAVAVTAAAKASESLERVSAGVSRTSKEAASSLGAQSAMSRKLAAEYAELGVSVQNAVEKYRTLRQEQLLGYEPIGKTLFEDAGIDADDIKLIEQYRDALNADPVRDWNAEQAKAVELSEAVAASHERVAAATRSADWADYKKQREAAGEALFADREQLKLAKEQAEAEARITAELQKQAKEAANAVRAKYTATHNTSSGTPTALAAISGSNLANIRASETALAKNELAIAANNQALFDMRKSLKTSWADIDQTNDKLANTRYALHDISMTMAVTGAAMIAGTGLFVKASADYETAIADIRRTSEMTRNEASLIRDEFVALAQEIPAAFTDIAKVGELAGQLNVPAERLADFSETVLQFSATTNVTAESAATAMGRLDALLPDVQGNYDALASSILKVGINSVATEQEIISTTSQIAAAGAQAGMSASQVIGLSASFASLGIAPETARGTVVRVLGLMNKAIAEGGASLQEYADIAGVSADEFANSWGSPAFGDTFLKFLGGIQQEGTKAQLTLADIGITAVRDQNNLLKLSQNTGLVVDAFADAATGFGNAGFLAENFSIRAETLNARIQVLMNTIQAFAAEAAESGAGALGELISLVSDMIKGGTELIKIPFVQTLVAVVGATLAAAGALALGTAAVTRFAASGLALPNIMLKVNSMLEIARDRFTVYSRAAAAAGTANTRFTQTLAGVNGALGKTGTVLKSVGSSVGALIALTAAIETFNNVANTMQSSTDKARESFNGFGGLAEAMATDLKAAESEFGSLENAVDKSAGRFSSLSVEIDYSNSALQDQFAVAAEAANSQMTLADALGKSTVSIQNNTIAIGENVSAQLRQMLLTDEVVEAMQRLEGMGDFDREGFITAFVQGDVAKAKQILADAVGTDGFGYEYQKFFDSLTGYESNATVLYEAVRQITPALEQAAAQAEITRIANDALGASAAQAAGTYSDAGTLIDAAGNEIASANEVVATSFDRLTTLQDAASAMVSVTEAFYGVSGGLEYMGGAAITNADTLMSAVQASIAAGQTLGVNAVDSVSAMFIALQQQGIDTAALLASLASMGIPSIGGVQLADVSAAVSGQRALAGAGSGLVSMFNSMAGAANKASSGVGNVGKSAGSAKQEIRTLVDYASDLAKVWSRAFEIRYSGGQASDKIVSSFRDIAKAVESANEKIADYQQKLQELSADAKSLASQRSVTEYFLMVAQSYGDVLRAGELSAKLADIDAKIAKNKLDSAKASKDLASAQQETNMTLVGNSDAAIRNRANILGLVQQYQSYIGALASSGMEQGQLQAMTNSLRQDFISQATQLGYNSAELGVYAAAFDDVTVAINNVPRNITVTANTNPAIQAFNEMKAAADRASAATTAARNNAGVAFPRPYVPQARYEAVHLPNNIAKDSAGKNLWAGTIQGYINGNTLYKYLGTWATGGYTGRGAWDEVAGLVHRGEYVIPKAGVNQSTGLPDAAWLMRNVLNMQGGGNSGERISNLTTINNNARNNNVQKVVVVQPVALDANTLHTLGNTDSSVYLDGQDIAKSSANYYARGTSIGDN